MEASVFSLGACGRSQLPPVLPGEVPAGIAVEVADGIAALHDCQSIRNVVFISESKRRNLYVVGH